MKGAAMLTYAEFCEKHRVARTQIRKVTALLQQPVQASAPFLVEGAWPFVVGGVLFGVGLLRGALGAVVGFLLGNLVAWLATRHRAAGMSFRTTLALSEGGLYAFRSGYWLGRPTALLGAWDLDKVQATVRSKRIATAVDLVVPDGRHLRFEVAMGARTWGETFLRLLPAEANSAE
jgi:hypothetical protein